MVKNKAVIVLKPQTASSQIATTYIEDVLDDFDINIVERINISCKTINEKNIIEQLLSDVSECATTEDATTIIFSKEQKDSFFNLFNVTLDDVIKEGKLLSASQYMKMNEKTPIDLLKLWAELGAEEISENLFIAYIPTDDVYVMNGFFYAHKLSYKNDDDFVVAMQVEFSIPWDQFNYEVIGSENPIAAHENSIRGYIYERAGVLEMFVDGIENVVYATDCPQNFSHDYKVWFKS